jgi:predicted metal-dependent hydrolase
MPEVKYGSKVIDYSIEVNDALKSHYISVEKHLGVILKGKPVSAFQAEQLVLKKAKWILNKLQLVQAVNDDEIVTGSRVLYLGRRYYTEVIFDTTIKTVEVQFNHSQFKILVNPDVDVQPSIRAAITEFYRVKAIEKIIPRVKRWSKDTGFAYRDCRVMKLSKRWGSCTETNNIIINIDAVKLPYSLIDYVIVHELCHTVVKNHSKDYWAEVSKYMVNWRELDEKLNCW